LLQQSISQAVVAIGSKGRVLRMQAERVPKLSHRLVQVLHAGESRSQAVVCVRRIGVQPQRLAKFRNGPLPIPSLLYCVREPAMSQGIGRIQTQGLMKFCDGPVQVAGLLEGSAQASMRLRVVRADFLSLLIFLQRALEVSRLT